MDAIEESKVETPESAAIGDPQSSAIAEPAKSLSRNARIKSFLKSGRFKLYCSYALSSAGDRMWTFAVSLAMVKITDDLRLVATSMAINGIAALTFSASLGRWIDRTPRLRAAATVLAANNISVALSAALLVILLHFQTTFEEWLKIVLVILIMVFGALSLLANSGTKIIVSKDWVVEMCAGDSALLAETNAMLVRIDMTSMIISPIVAGQLMTSINLAAGCLFIAGWNVCSFGLELYLLWLIYKATPQLARKTRETPASASPDEKEKLTNPETTGEIETPVYAVTTVPQNSEGRLSRIMRSALSGWKTYYQQDVFPAALGLALLYLTVLGLDGITTGYAYAQGMEENVLAIVRGVGALFGISGTFAFPAMRRRFGIERTGLMASCFQLVPLALCVVSIWLSGSPLDIHGYFYPVEQNTTISAINGTKSNDGTILIAGATISIWIFLCGVVFARFGLWMIDLTITQVMQERIGAHERGVVNGVQNALQESFDMVKSFLCILLPSSKTFGVLIVVSYVAVFCGHISYALYSRKIRGHLFHFNRLRSCVFNTDDAQPRAQAKELPAREEVVLQTGQT